MSFTVKKALQREIFRECSLLTGIAGLGNVIRWVNILEILDDLTHIEPGEFLITTAHGFDAQEIAKQQTMIELFATRKLAAMAIQTGHYIREIPPSFIELAKQYGIPLIEIPPEVSFKSLTRALMNELIHHERAPNEEAGSGETRLRRTAQLTEMKALWRKLIKHDNPQDLHEDISRQNFSTSEPVLVLALSIGTAHPEQLPQKEELRSEALPQLEQALADILMQRHTPFLVGSSKEQKVLLLALEQPASRDSSTEATLSDLFRELRLLFPGFMITGGASNAHKNINEIRPAVSEAKKALQASVSGLFSDSGIVSYQKLGLYRLIMDIKNLETLKELYQETAAPLLRYDRRCSGSLMQTLTEYLEQGRIKDAADALFIHRHTMRYRLAQIKELTGYDPLLSTDAFQLNIGLHIYHYLLSRGLLPRQ